MLLEFFKFVWIRYELYFRFFFWKNLIGFFRIDKIFSLLYNKYRLIFRKYFEERKWLGYERDVCLDILR